MSNYTLREVTDKKTVKEFLEVQARLYEHDPMYVRPLDQDIEEVFDPAKNHRFQHGEAVRWILVDEKGKTVGRVAAFIDYSVCNKDNEQPTGSMGFFDCINDKEAASVLFDQCKQWLQSKGMEAMEGPVNFGERAKWWGLLAEGFQQPNYDIPYNYPYYQNLFEAYGFQNYFNQFTYLRPISMEGVHPLLVARAERIYKNPEYSFQHINKKNLEPYVEAFCSIYNMSWSKFGVPPMTKEGAWEMLKGIKPIMDERLIWFAFHEGKPIAFFVNIPEINPIIKKLNGKFSWWAKLKFFYYMKRGIIDQIYGLIFAIAPEYRGRGVEAALIMSYAKEAFKPKFPYKRMELIWIGDFNPAMMHMVEQVGGKICKTHITYRYLFDRTKEFKRAPKVS
jgi:GNAT superfamily N-acetyltransferase